MITRSSQETQKIAYDLAKKVLASKVGDSAKVLALVGNLGAGKTTFIQGFARGLGIKHRIVSPTFLIFRNYKVKSKIYKKFYHVDAYRIKKNRELINLGFKNILHSPFNIVLIEWADKISAKGGSASVRKRILPLKTIWIKFKYGKKENERKIEFSH